MGITDFYQVIKDECPEQLGKVYLKELAGYKFAIDISCFLYRYVRSSGETRWMSPFILLLCTLKKHGIKAVCVFDGPNSPPEKKKEREARRAQLQKTTTRLQECIRLRDNLLRGYCPTRKSPEVNLKKECRMLIRPRRGRKDNTNYDDPGDVAQSLTLTIQRLEKQIIPITDKHKETAKSIVRMMGMACFQADGEAETLCAYLACRGDVDAVLTEDTDVLAYGCPVMVAFKNFKLGDNRLYALRHDKILEALGFSHKEFLDLCILLRCDYNRWERDSVYGTVKGFPPDGIKRKSPTGIGQKRAFLMIKKWRRLEEVTKHIVNPELLIFRRCRELFTLPESIPDVGVPYNGPLDLVGLKNLIQENGLTISLSYIENCWKPGELVFESDSDCEASDSDCEASEFERGNPDL